MEKYLKSIAGANNKKVLASWLPQSKLYLKITGIPFIQPNSNKLNSEDVNNLMSCTEIFENISLAAKPRIIKASPKSNIAIIWFDIWDSRSGSSAKLLINHSFNFGRYIATIKATNINPGASSATTAGNGIIQPSLAELMDPSVRNAVGYTNLNTTET